MYIYIYIYIYINVYRYLLICNNGIECFSLLLYSHISNLKSLIHI